MPAPCPDRHPEARRSRSMHGRSSAPAVRGRTCNAAARRPHPAPSRRGFRPRGGRASAVPHVRAAMPIPHAIVRRGRACPQRSCGRSPVPSRRAGSAPRRPGARWRRPAASARSSRDAPQSTAPPPRRSLVRSPPRGRTWPPRASPRDSTGRA